MKTITHARAGDVDVFANELPDHEAQMTAYETAGLSRPDAFALEAYAASIISIGRRGVVDIGQQLLAARDRARYGTWQPFLDRCGLSEATARNYMNVAERFADKPATVALLPPAALYAMAAPSADLGVVDAIVREVASGTRPKPSAIKGRLRDARPPGSPSAPTCTRCGRPSADLTSYAAGLVPEYLDQAVRLCPQCVPALLAERARLVVGQRTDPHKPDPKEPPAAELTMHDLDALLPAALQKAGYFWKERATGDPYVIAHTRGNWTCDAHTVEACLLNAHAHHAHVGRSGAVDWNAVARESYHLGAATAADAAWVRVASIIRLLAEPDRAGAIAWLLTQAAALAPDDLSEMASRLDDAAYEALACYRRDRSVPARESEGR